VDLMVVMKVDLLEATAVGTRNGTLQTTLLDWTDP
jgi:hypothetical protein